MDTKRGTLKKHKAAARDETANTRHDSRRVIVAETRTGQINKELLKNSSFPESTAAPRYPILLSDLPVPNRSTRVFQKFLNSHLSRS